MSVEGFGVALQGIGAGLDYLSAQRNIKFQKKFAKKGIQWRVADAKKAGLHPLYALGAQVPAFSPVQDATGSALAAMGQDISRSRKATLSPSEQQLLDLQIAQAQAGLDRTYAETALLQSERLKTVSGMFQFLPEPNVPERGRAGQAFGGQTINTTRQKVPADTVTPLAPDLPSATSGNAGVVAGVPPGFRAFRMPNGSRLYFPTSSADLAEAMESTFESIPAALMWWQVNKQMNPHFAWDMFTQFAPGSVVSGVKKHLNAAQGVRRQFKSKSKAAARFWGSAPGVRR